MRSIIQINDNVDFYGCYCHGLLHNCYLSAYSTADFHSCEVREILKVRGHFGSSNHCVLALGTQGCRRNSKVDENFFKVNRTSCLTTQLLRSRQPNSTTFLKKILFLHFKEVKLGCLKQKGKQQKCISQKCQRDATWRLSFHVNKLSRHLHVEPGFSVIYLLDSGWPRGTAGKQLSTSIIREGKANTNTPRLTFKTKWRFNRDFSLHHPSSCLPICQEGTRAKKKKVLLVIYPYS